jgi:hypothetical protein
LARQGGALIAAIATIATQSTWVGSTIARAKRASAVHDQSDAYRDFLRTLATDEELAAIYLRGLRDFGSIKDVELVRFASALGFLFRASMFDMLAYPGVREWWATRSHWYSTPFRELIHAKAAEAGARMLYREPTA